MAVRMEGKTAVAARVVLKEKVAASEGQVVAKGVAEMVAARQEGEAMVGTMAVTAVAPRAIVPITFMVS